jgi:enoyl-CoA hydratase
MTPYEAKMSYETIALQIDGAVATIRLNRPERMNAVIEEMYLELQDALGRISADGNVRALILTGSVLEREGAVKQAFCAGADLKKHAAGERSAEDKRRYIDIAHETARMLFELPKPVIAAVNGPARGAGAELAIACDFILMAEDATIAFPEVGLGTFVGGGATHILPRLVGLARSKELVYTGRVIDGRAAVEMGLALSCCPLADLAAHVGELAAELAGQAPLSVAFAKKLLHISPRKKIGKALQSEARAILACMESEDWHEGLRAFGEKRRPEFKGE